MIDILNTQDGIDCIIDVVTQTKEKPAVIVVEGFAKEYVHDLIAQAKESLTQYNKKGMIKRRDMPLESNWGDDYLILEGICMVDTNYGSKLPDFIIYTQPDLDPKTMPCFSKRHIENGRYDIIIDPKLRVSK